MKVKTYTIHVCGPWKPSEVSGQFVKLFGHGIEDAIIKLINPDWITVFYRNNIVHGAIVYSGTDY